jgi:hypothetical protein
MTLVRSPIQPAILGGTAILTTFFTKSSEQRSILASIIIASSLQFITLELMLRFQRPVLVILILIASDFITFRYLQYGRSLLRETHNDRRETPSHRPTIKEVGHKSGTVVSISGIVLRLTVIVVAVQLGIYFLAGHEAFSQFGLVTLGVVTSPIILLVIVQQYRLRKILQSRN